MRIQQTGLATALAIVAPLAALAGEPGSTTEAAQPVALEQQTNPVVCHYFYHEGTVIKQQVCRPQHEWERRRFALQRDLLDFQLRRLTHNN